MKTKLRRKIEAKGRKFLESTQLVQDLNATNRKLSCRAVNAEKDVRELKDRIAPIAHRMAQVSVQRNDDRAYPRLRICVEIDARMLEQGLMHGNDDSIIQYIGEDIGHRVAHDIKRMNFERWGR